MTSFYDNLATVAANYPPLRRFCDQGFVLSRPVLSMEIEIPIETQNQRFIINRETGDLRVNTAE